MCALFSKDKSDKPDQPSITRPSAGESGTALKMIIDGKEREVSFAELTLSNNLSQQALARLLIKKGVITAEELLEMMQTIRSESYSQTNPSEEQN